jgi:quercetin dioxygenase-like cupin family protein
MTIKKAGTVSPQKVDRATKTKIEWLVDRHDGAPNFEMRRFVIGPGGSIPKHYHPDIEHEQYVLKGEYEIGIGTRKYRLKEGDSVYIPPATPHWYRNTGRTDAEFICVVPKTEKYESIYEEAKPQPKSRGASRRRV